MRGARRPSKPARGRRPRRSLRAAAILAPLLLALRPAPALAHPLGNFTVNAYAGLVLSRGAVQVRYVLDLAEIPTFQELPRIDADGDGEAGVAELDRWAEERAGEILGRLSLVVGGERVELRAGSSRAELRPGQGGLPVLRLEATFVGPLPRAGAGSFEDGNLPGRIGWREVTVSSAPGVLVRASSVPRASASDELRAYPEDLLSSPLRVTRATFRFVPGLGGGGAATGDGAGAGRPGPPAPRPGTDGGLAGLVARAGGSPAVFALSLLAALGFGALHAVGPGHGKTLVAAYLVGSGGRLRDAVRVGLAVAAMHAASVLALGLAILVGGRSLAPERAYPWLGAAAGSGAAVLGTGLLVSRLRRLRRGQGGAHVHPHGDHHHAHGGAGGASAPRLLPLAFAGGILPSPGALVALLAAVALGRLGLGLLLIAAFSLGLAVTLVVVGAVAVRARDAVAGRLGGRLPRAIPIGSAAALALVGLALAARGLWALGV
ncbi:MAG TPA: nickel transporter [Actinomycetota bacterium]|nr:nickel transporter [Actinomycetota bacterium]